MTQREETGFDAWKEQKTVTIGPVSFQPVKMFQYTMGKTSGNLKKWIVLKLFSARMINMSITLDTGCGMQVHGWETTRWPSFIRWGSKSRREAFSEVLQSKTLLHGYLPGNNVLHVFQDNSTQTFQSRAYVTTGCAPGDTRSSQAQGLLQKVSTKSLRTSRETLQGKSHRNTLPIEACDNWRCDCKIPEGECSWFE
jgi:hypothetical protein